MSAASTSSLPSPSTSSSRTLATAGSGGGLFGFMGRRMNPGIRRGPWRGQGQVRGRVGLVVLQDALEVGRQRNHAARRASGAQWLWHVAADE